MQCIRFVNLRTFFFYNEILFERSKELCRSQTIEVFNHTVIINNSQLIGRKTYRHEIVILFISTMIRILFCLLSTYKRGSGRTVMSVSNIECRHFSKLSCDRSDILCLVYNPESMSETITRSYKIVNRILSSIFLDDGIQLRIIRICKEYRFNVGIVHADMFHAIFFFVTTGQFMLLDNTIHIIRHISTHNKSVLCLTIHCLSIDVIVFFIILHQPAFVLKQFKVIGSFDVHLLVMLIRTYRKIYFRLNYMIE